jgi:adenine-specific DNA-methyltransferase
VEQRIKEKIELIGKPLKEWNINIYRGVLTGYNDAFIIDGNKKQELITIDPKSAEIIRPILRGRDIKRYTHDFADLWIIATFPSLKIDIERYPAIKEHLLGFGYGRLNQSGESGARKKTNNQWFETQDSIMYWEDFSKQKIIYPEITKFLNFYHDTSGFYVNNKCFILTGTHIYYLTAFLNSSLFKFCFKNNFPELLGGTRELRKIFIEEVPIVEIDDTIEAKCEGLINKIYLLRSNHMSTKYIEEELDDLIFNLYNLSPSEKNEIGFIEI